MKRKYRNRHVKKLVPYNPHTGHGPEFTERLLKVLRDDPDLEGWQIEERFGLAPSAIHHYRTQVHRKTG